VVAGNFIAYWAFRQGRHSTLATFRSPISALQQSATEPRLVAVGCDDGSLHIYDLLARRVGGGGGSCVVMAWSHDRQCGPPRTVKDPQHTINNNPQTRYHDFVNCLALKPYIIPPFHLVRLTMSTQHVPVTHAHWITGIGHCTASALGCSAPLPIPPLCLFCAGHTDCTIG